MRFSSFFLTMLMVCFSLVAIAQQPAAAPKADKPNDTTKASASAPTQAPAAEKPADAVAETPAPAGDIITLKTGKVLKGVQVVKSTPKAYEVEIIKGDPPLLIPRGQVESIQYDSIEPERAKKTAPETLPEEKVMPADKLTPELLEKLKAPLGDPCLKFANEDIAKIMGDLAKRAKVTITIDDSVTKLPADQKKFTIETTKDMTLMSLLEEKVIKEKKGFNVEYHGDNVIIAVVAPEAPVKK